MNPNYRTRLPAGHADRTITPDAIRRITSKICSKFGRNLITSELVLLRQYISDYPIYRYAGDPQGILEEAIVQDFIAWSAQSGVIQQTSAREMQEAAIAVTNKENEFTFRDFALEQTTAEDTTTKDHTKLLQEMVKSLNKLAGNVSLESTSLTIKEVSLFLDTRFRSNSSEYNRFSFDIVSRNVGSSSRGVVSGHLSLDRVIEMRSASFWLYIPQALASGFIPPPNVLNRTFYYKEIAVYIEELQSQAHQMAERGLYFHFLYSYRIDPVVLTDGIAIECIPKRPYDRVIFNPNITQISKLTYRIRDPFEEIIQAVDQRATTITLAVNGVIDTTAFTDVTFVVGDIVYITSYEAQIPPAIPTPGQSALNSLLNQPQGFMVTTVGVGNITIGVDTTAQAAVTRPLLLYVGKLRIGLPLRFRMLGTGVES